jgi:hypothetical protein
VFFIFSQGLENLVRNAQISGRRREGSHACCGNAGCDSVENRREINLSPRIGTCRTNKGTEDLYGIEKNDKRMFSQLYLAETQVIQETFQVVGKFGDFAVSEHAGKPFERMRAAKDGIDGLRCTLFLAD